MLGELDGQDAVAEYLRRGLADDDAMVNRAAVMASAKHPSDQFVQPLFELIERTDTQDVHLRHAIRMSLRDHLRDEGLLRRVAVAIEKDDVQLLGGICLALNSKAARHFVADHIEQLAGNDRGRLGQYIKFAMYDVVADRVNAMVSVAKATFADDRASQLDLLRAVRQGQTAGSTLPQNITDWAHELAVDLLALNRDVSPIAWSYIAHPATSVSQNPWAISNRRLSSDTKKPTILWSSFLHGEQRTGIFRSETFALPEHFEFFIAGHDGFPGKPIEGNNMVRLRDAQTHKVLQTWSPPRNDVAQRRVFKPTEPRRQVYVELVDGDTGSAYAWLAVGRFSVEGLNPSLLLQNRRMGAALAGEFRLLPLRKPLLNLARSTQDTTTSAAMVRAAASMQDDAACRALAEAMAVPLDLELRLEIIEAVDRTEVDIDLLARALKYATFTDQLRIAGQLVGNRSGASLLLDLLESGQADGRLLLIPAARARLDAVASPFAVARDGAHRTRTARAGGSGGRGWK